MYSTSDLYEMAQSYGADGRGLYVKARFTFDLVWPLVYTLFLVTIHQLAFWEGASRRVYLATDEPGSIAGDGA